MKITKYGRFVIDEKDWGIENCELEAEGADPTTLGFYLSIVDAFAEEAKQRIAKAWAEKGIESIKLENSEFYGLSGMLLPMETAENGK